MLKKEDFSNLINVDFIKENEPLKNHTTFGTGGEAEIFMEPNGDELIKLIPFLNEKGISYTVLGNGSNVLVSDHGLPGVTIKIGRRMNGISFDEAKDWEEALLKIEAGALMGNIGRFSKDNALTGFEALSGIPGSFGGAVLMNAGAYNSEIKDVIVDARILKSDGTVITLKKEELDLSYRHSVIDETGGIVLSGRIRLKKGNKEEIISLINEYITRRKTSQPLEFKSAGSTFKRPVKKENEEQRYASRLIDGADLKGASVGDAEVSRKHAGFLINKGSASSNDIYNLMELVKASVFKKYDILLEPEVKLLGRFP